MIPTFLTRIYQQLEVRNDRDRDKSDCINCEIVGGLMRNRRSWGGGGEENQLLDELLTYHHKYFRRMSRNFWGGVVIFLAFFNKNCFLIIFEGWGVISKNKW